MTERRRGRPRNEAIDAELMSVTLAHLAERGYDGLSIKAVAEAAGTTRQAIYRRYPGKADLATAAVASMSEAHLRLPTDDPRADLVAELEAFRRGISRPNGLALAATMLQPGTDEALVRLYRERIVWPRRAALGAILERARDGGLIAPGADIAHAVTALTGSWYGYAVAGIPPTDDWAQRTATLAWRGLGGEG